MFSLIRHYEKEFGEKNELLCLFTNQNKFKISNKFK